MSKLFEELIQQTDSLRNLITSYRESDLLSRLVSNLDGASRWVLTGMGASFHAAQIGSFYLNYLGIPTVALEASDLTNYVMGTKKNCDVLVYLSQSGSSGEVIPLIDTLQPNTILVGVTCGTNSPLASRAKWVLPLESGEETLIASKTYLNSIALLWLLARKIAGVWDGSEWVSIEDIAFRVEGLLKRSDEIKQNWIDQIGNSSHKIFLGHGPNSVTARQSAMILGEWSKIPVHHFGIGAFRHGFIETINEDSAVVIFNAQGQTSRSAQVLSKDLAAIGAKVLLVENGETYPSTPNRSADEFLSPLLDIIPVQLFADEIAIRLNVTSGFRYISKVVTRL
jgi:glutamine---fructose-6-phosphate transaminase (isomerizing)